MPKLWTQTIEGHRAVVWQSIVDTTAALVAESGLRAVTMSEVAEKVGIGRATLYKYFPDVDSIMFAWHEQVIAHHLEQLKQLADTPGPPGRRLSDVLERYALNRHEHSGHDLAGLLHQGEHMAHAESALASFIEELIDDGVEAGHIRDDIAPKELATYCLHALSAAPDLPSKAAVKRLVMLTSAALRPPPSEAKNHGGELP